MRWTPAAEAAHAPRPVPATPGAEHGPPPGRRAGTLPFANSALQG
eukprot:CAMPEP_0176220824 /NCGR_PEP_ID=MMETSP0121_2-20121125/19415_1 /TAXON_ID=160619 /ORGANISM="Kryptoperidinium foliaceum, Strain CCMP 1326" /LENGTH=44 /DNA_ID= /DNA_START= /DNA_END= /DNA_ORIENTATION=